MSLVRVVIVFFLILSLTSCKSSSQETDSTGSQKHSKSFQKAKAEEAGLSADRLSRLCKFIQRSINEGKIAGAVALVMRKSKVVFIEALGKMDEGKPMREDTIFRVASMTKPITSVAIMMLAEEGKLSLDEPVSKYIFEFKTAQVATINRDKKINKLVPVKNEITVRHLLTHTSGIIYRFSEIEPWSAMYQDAGISDGLSQTEGKIGDNVKKIARMPLAHQPGERFSYGLSTDVLGYLVEVVSQMTLNEFFRKRIFEPLQMKDTSFFLSAEKLHRLAAVYQQLPGGHIKKMSDEPTKIGHLTFSSSFPYKGPRTYYSGGVGLVSTVHDYARFLQMMLNGGELDGERIVSEKTVELMTVNQIGDLPSASTLKGFGFGFGLFKDFDKIGKANQYGWSGFFHTSFFVDPHEKMIGIFMSQFYPSDLELQERFRTLAYYSIVERME